MPTNTTRGQDEAIYNAEKENHVANLISIIEDLDAQISDWRAAAQCDSPEELIAKLATLNT